jgi:flagellar protein FlgJ
MNTDLSNLHSVADLQGFGDLKRAARDGSPEALRETARQFEALFVQMMLKSMREATTEGGLFESQKDNVYRDLYDQQIALNLSRGRGIGLADSIAAQLGGEQAAPVRALGGLPLPERAAAADFAPATPAEFARGLWPHAQRAGAALGVAPEALVAQAALETGWGQAQLRGEDGRPSFNVFNIKASRGWAGERVATETTEYVDGVAQRERAEFRAYPSLGAAFDDYVRLIGESPRYAEARAAGGDPLAYAQALQRAGYATDPRYAEKIESILTRGSFSALLADLKGGTPWPMG